MDEIVQAALKTGYGKIIALRLIAETMGRLRFFTHRGAKIECNDKRKINIHKTTISATPRWLPVTDWRFWR